MQMQMQGNGALQCAAIHDAGPSYTHRSIQINSSEAAALQHNMSSSPVMILDAAALHWREHTSFWYHINEELLSLHAR
jgi:hypothetical protein